MSTPTRRPRSGRPVLALFVALAACAPEPVNHAPELVPPSDAWIDLGETLSVTLEASDPDGDGMFFDLASGPGGAVLAGREISWDTTGADPGAYTFLVSVEDHGEPHLQDHAAFLVTVVDPDAPGVNHPPVLVPPADASVDVGATLSVVLGASDADGDALVLSLEAGPAAALLADDTLTWTPAQEDVGAHGLLVSATDDGVPPLSDHAAFTVSVRDPLAPGVNHPPVLVPVADATVSAGEGLEVVLDVADPDGDDVGLALEVGPDDMLLDGDTLSWTPDLSDVGVHPVFVSATDDGVPPLSDYVLFQVTVVDPDAPGINHPPALVPPVDRVVAAGDLLSASLVATDPDGDVVVFGLEDGPDDAVLAGDTLTWTPQLQDVGAHGIVVSATDDGVPPLTDLAAFAVTVFDPDAPGVNHPPEVEPVPGVVLPVGDTLALPVVATDPDPDDSLTWQAVLLPTGADLDDAGPTLTWTPVAGDLGPHQALLQVTDDGEPALSAWLLVDVEVVAPGSGDAPPIFTVVPSAGGLEACAPVDLEFEAWDPEGVGVTFWAPSLPEGATLEEVIRSDEATTARLTWLPTQDQPGDYALQLYAVDDATHVATPLVYLLEIPAVPPPSVEPYAVFRGGQDDALPVAAHPCYEVEVTSAMPEGATWDPDASEVRWTPENEDFGIYWLTYTVTDQADPPVQTDLSGYLAVAFYEPFMTFTGWSFYEVRTQGLAMTYEPPSYASGYEDGWGLYVHSWTGQAAPNSRQKAWAWRMLDRSELPVGALAWAGRGYVAGHYYGYDQRVEVVPYAVTDPAATWPEWDTVAPGISYPIPHDGYNFVTWDESGVLDPATTEVTLALLHVDPLTNWDGHYYWDRLEVTPLLPPPVEVDIDWVADCDSPAPSVVKATDLPAGTWRVTALASGATKLAVGGWQYHIDCENLAADTLVTPSDPYFSPGEAWAHIEATTEEVDFAGGDLVCGIADSPCDDNQGSIRFEMTYLHP